MWDVTQANAWWDNQPLPAVRPACQREPEPAVSSPAPADCAIVRRGRAEPHVQACHPVLAKFGGTTVQSRKCTDCGYVTFPTPPADTLRAFYQTEYPEGAAAWYNVEADFTEWKRRSRSRRVLDIAKRFGLERGVFHEAGCAFGGTVFELQSLGLRATGTELNAAAVAQGRARGADIHAMPDVEFLTGRAEKPNVVFGFHMLEHMPDPVAWLTALRAGMADEAIAIFFVPNAMAAFPLVYHYMRYVWYGYPEHLHLFSPRSLLCLAERAGFELSHVAANPFGIQPEATNRIALPLPGNPVAERLRDHAMREALLHEELEFVVVPRGSKLAARFAAPGIATRARCERSGEFERNLGVLMKTAPAPEPWSEPPAG